MKAKEKLRGGDAVQVLLNDDIRRGTVCAVLGRRVNVKLDSGKSVIVERALVESVPGEKA